MKNGVEDGPPAHVGETVEQLGKLYEEHQRHTTRIQRFANQLTATLSRPGSLMIIVLLVVGWVAGNYVARSRGEAAIESWPFPDLEFVVAVVSLSIALLILSTQRHQDDLAEKRARLTLQLAALSERKIAKIIDLLEEQRRDNPMLPTRPDLTAEEMSVPADPSAEIRR